LTAAVAALLVGVSCCVSAAQEQALLGLDEKNPLRVNKRARQVRILVDLQPEAFSGGWIKWTPNYHAVVWKGGKASGEALLASYADDASFYNAMVSIGAVPGDNLTMAAGEERKDPESPTPDERVKGTPVQIVVWWPGLAAGVPLKEMLIDPAGKGIDMRFGGNKALIPEWRSGCIACLYSCPGGKVGNHSYTIRDYVKGTTKFAVDYSKVPKGKRRAVVFFTLRKE